jgi:hypothetical protein
LRRRPARSEAERVEKNKVVFLKQFSNIALVTVKICRMKDLDDLKTCELLRLYSDLLKELANRKIVRTTNNPVAGVAEYLVVNAFGLKRARQSNRGYNATDKHNRRYEIKSRRLTQHNQSRMLSAIRECELGHFDYLAGVLFNEDFSLYKACLVPHGIVLRESTFQKHVNAHILELEDTLWACEGVVDITDKLKAVPGVF